MKEYIVIKRWHDLQDNNHQYQPGDIYPRKGLEPTKKRCDELISTSNKRKICLIKEVEDTKGNKKTAKEKTANIKQEAKENNEKK